MPKKTSAFAVNPQEPQENQSLSGYSTGATYFVPGSDAAVSQSKRRHPTLPPLTPLLLPNLTSSSNYSYYDQNYGLMTPETPSNNVVYRNFPLGPSGQQSEYFTPNHSSYGNDQVLSYRPNSTRPSNLGVNLLFTAPNPSLRAPVHSPITPTSPDDYWSDLRPPFQGGDLTDRDAIAQDLSPLTFEHDTAPLPPHFSEDEIDAGEEEFGLPRTSTQSLSKSAAIISAHKTLQRARLTPTLMLIDLLEAAAEGTINARLGEAFYRSTNEANIHRLLDLIWANKDGASMLKAWMAPQAVNLVCDAVHREMELAKRSLYMTTAETTPEFIESWDINAIMDPVSRDITPTWSAILTAATEPKIKEELNEVENETPSCRRTTRNIISAQVHYRRSFKSAKVPIGLGLMAWSTGASRALISILHKAGLSNAYSSISYTVRSLQKFSLDQAYKISREPHSLSYDNVNFSLSIHYEQHPGSMSKVQTGTFPVIYKLSDVNPQHLKLQPLLDNLKKSLPLKLYDIRPTKKSILAYRHQTAVSIAKILFEYCSAPELENIAHDPLLQYQPRRPLPKGRKTLFYPLSVSTIEEASVTGNLHVHDNVYIEQLKHTADSDYLNNVAIPCLNDQLTNARIRGAQSLRAKDVNSWERREVFQLAFGTFHLVMNLIWALLHTHRGRASEHGSLTYYFNLLEKARLGNDRPDYYTLLAALKQILKGLIFNAWRIECGYASLDAFAASNPTPEDILCMSTSIIDRYATPQSIVLPTDVPTRKKDASQAELDDPAPYVDHVHSNTILLTRDLLYVLELTTAMSEGDFGRIEDILPQVACVFRGAGSNNYSMEVLHFIFNTKYVWTPEFGNIMRDIMLVNPSGREGHSMAIDMNIEHCIGYLKSLFSAKGLYSHWGRLSDISAVVNYLQLIKKKVTTSLGCAYQGSTHMTPDTSALVIRVANRARELKLQEYVEAREVQSRAIPDLHQVGYRKYEMSSLAAFNKKLEQFKLGREFETDEVDDLPQANFGAEDEIATGESEILSTE